MKKTLLALSLLSFLTLGAQAQTKVALIDLRKIFDGYYKTKQADAMLKDEANDLAKQREEMLTSLKKGEEEWKKLLEKSNDQSLSADERAKSKQTAEKKFLGLKEDEQTLQQFENSSRTRLGEKQRKKRDLILEEIRAAIKARAQASGYNLVIDSAAQSINDTPIVLFAETDAKNDLTDVVLNQINAGAPADAVKPADAKPVDKKDDKKAK
ncbi:MAG: hlpA [Verrucomicrobiales bacterium]|nr:hlpA [Verrucomicrobiales bacterium]